MQPQGHPESAALQEPQVHDLGGSLVRWSPPAQLGRLRIQAPEGLRAAVVPLKPGLYLVAEVEGQQTALAGMEVGAIAMASAITAAARGALKLKERADREGVSVRELVQDRAQKGVAVLKQGRALLERQREDRVVQQAPVRPEPLQPWSSVAGGVRWGSWQ